MVAEQGADLCAWHHWIAVSLVAGSYLMSPKSPLSSPSSCHPSIVRGGFCPMQWALGQILVVTQTSFVLPLHRVSCAGGHGSEGLCGWYLRFSFGSMQGTFREH